MDSMTATAPTGDAHARPTRPRGGALRFMIAVFGVLAGLAAVEHAVGEILQGPVRPPGLVFRSWPGWEAFAPLDGEPAMTVVPNLLASGLLTIVVALAFAVWAVWFVDRRYGGLVLLGLSLLLLLVGGGFGPPLIGVVLGVAALRLMAVPDHRPGTFTCRLARAWKWLVGAALLGFLSLLPGTVLLKQFLGFDAVGLVAALPAYSFAALLLALVAARGQDRMAGDELKEGTADAPRGGPRRRLHA